jgi:hypothetical protein
MGSSPRKVLEIRFGLLSKRFQSRKRIAKSLRIHWAELHHKTWLPSL